MGFSEALIRAVLNSRGRTVLKPGTKVYHGTPTGAVTKEVEKKGVLLGMTPDRKMNAGLTDEGGLIWTSPDARVGNFFATGGEWADKGHVPESGWGSVFEHTVEDPISVIGYSKGLSKEEADAANRWIPSYKQVEPGRHDFGNARHRVGETDKYRGKDPLHAMTRSMGYDAFQYGDTVAHATKDKTLPVRRLDPDELAEIMAAHRKEAEALKARRGGADSRGEWERRKFLQALDRDKFLREMEDEAKFKKILIGSEVPQDITGFLQWLKETDPKRYEMHIPGWRNRDPETFLAEKYEDRPRSRKKRW